ncbi:prefoldin subunit beta [Candidatus Woesearchaeota archaeon]|nr:prefoldin subunit beta [Candidatus Woesearchaeota archaeon]
MTDKKTQEKIHQLQLFEQNLQNLLLQKQQFQSQIQENKSALDESKDQKDVYKIIGNIMVKSDAEKIRAELETNLEMAELRIKTIEKQEKAIREKANVLQKEVVSEMKKEEEK